MEAPRKVAAVSLPTAHGEFEAHAFECASGFVYLALTRGALAGGGPLLTRLHSECLTGDALGSLRCDCGVQLRLALRAIAAEGRGVLVYATGHEGRGIGLINKLLAYAEQDDGADTLDANLRLGLPVDGRHYADAAAVLGQLGVRSVRLLTNNPAKVSGLQAAGMHVEAVPIPTAAHTRNRGYLRTKELRLGHHRPTGSALNGSGAHAHDGDALDAGQLSGNGSERRSGEPLDVSELLGRLELHADRPHVVLKYAQTLDGRIATAAGDAKWISGEGERSISHALRAACDGVLVGIGTVLQDDPQLTVRMVPGASPVRVVLDSTLRIPEAARVLDDEATTIVLTTERSASDRREALRTRGVGVRVVASAPGGVDVKAALETLRLSGVRSLLVEGGAKVITSLLAAGMADRVIVGMAPTIIGAGTEAVGDLGTARVAEGVRLTNRCLHVMDDDLLVAWDVDRDHQPAPAPA